MNSTTLDPPNRRAPARSAGSFGPLHFTFVLLAVIWTAILGLALSWNLWQGAVTTREEARLAARTSVEEDFLARLLVMSHGGVYVPVTDDTPPNPALTNVAERDITTPSGRKLTLLEPTYLVRRASTPRMKRYQHHAHLTSLAPLYPGNAADAWETNALRAFARGQKEVSSVETMGGEPYLRLMRPLVTKTGCLECHAAQGFKEGDILGGISVSVPLAPHEAAVQAHERGERGALGLLWALGLGGVGGGFLLARRRWQERARSETALQESETRFRQLFENAPVAYHSLDAEGRILEINPAWQTMLGYRREEVLGRPIAEFMEPSQVPLLQEQFLHYKATGRMSNAEFVFRRKDGPPVVVLVEGRIGYDEQSRFKQTHCVLYNLTERKRAELALRASEERYRALVDCAQDAIFTIAPNAVLTSLNPAFETMTGRSRADWVGKEFPQLVHTHDLPLALDMFRRVLGGEKSAVFELRILSQSGQPTPMEFTATPQLENGTVIGVLGIGRDITERKRAAEVLRQERDFAVNLTNALGQGVSVTDAEGRFEFVNPALAAMLGRTPAEMIGRNVRDFIVPEELGRFEAAQRQRLQGRTSTYELSLRHAEGHRVPVMVTGVPRWQQDQVRGSIGVMTDLSARQQAEVALRESEERYRRLVESSPEAIMVHCEGKFVFVNQAGVKLFGAADAAQLIGQPILARVRPDFHAVVQQRIAGLYAGSPAPLHEEKFIRLDGSEVDVEAVGSRITFYGKDAIQVTVRDISGRKRTEKLSKVFAHLAERLNTATTTQVAGDLIVKAADALLGWDCCFLDLYDGARGLAHPVVRWDVINGQRTQLAIPASELKPSPHFLSVLQEGKQLILRQPEGTEDPTTAPFGDTDRRSASLLYAPLRHGEETVGVLSIQSYTFNAYDAAALEILQTLADHCGGALQRIRTAEALRESETLYHSLVENLQQHIFRKDTAGRFTFGNGPFCRGLGKPLADILGKTDLDFCPNELATKYRQDDERVIQTGEPFAGEETFRQADGQTVYVKVLKTPLRDAAGQIIGIQGISWDITERKRAEEAARANDQRMRLATEAAEVGIWEWHLETNRVRWDAQMFRLYGITPTENGLVDYSDWSGAVLPEDLPHQEAMLQETVRGRGRGLREFRIRRRNDGEVRDIQAVEVVRINAEGRAEWVLGTNRDITETKRAEKGLKESLSLLEATLESTADGILVADGRGKMVRFNRRFVEMWRLPEEVVASGSDEAALNFVLAQLREPERFLAKVRELYHQPEATSMDLLTFKDGRVFERYSQPQRIAGTIIGRVWSFRDITEREQAEAELHRLATAVAQAAEAIVLTDLRGVIQYVNPAFERVSGYTALEALGKNPRLLKSGKHDAAFYQQLWDTLLRGQVWHGRIINKRKDGALYEEEATISPVRDAEGRLENFVAVKRDITREVQLESQLRQMQKLEAIGQLAGGVAHDFNNILAAIMMRLGLLQMHPALDEETRAAVKELQAGAARAANLTRQLLMFSRRSVLETKALDLNEVIENLLKMLRRLIGEQIDLRFDGKTGLPRVEADAGMLEQVLMNLVVNARDAMPKGGRLTIRTTLAEVDTRQAGGHLDRRPGRFVCLTVADEGCGMDTATRQRIFEPFFTTKEAGKGTGLGLATVYGIVAQHKGWIEVESEVGHGSTFQVFLPALSAAPADKPAAPPRATTVPCGSETILLVEDDLILRQTTARSLRKLGYKVLEAASAGEAQALWSEHGSQIQLLFTDVVLPEAMTGLELAAQLLERKPNLKVIVSSGYSAELVSAGAPTQAGIAYLPKPFDASVLGAAVRKSLDQAS